MFVASEDTGPDWRRRKFTPEEDEILKTAAEQPKRKTWVEIAKALPGRTAMQCRDRYKNYLEKEITKEPWSLEEDKMIIDQYKVYGRRWVEIAKFLPGRSGNHVKNRWYKHLYKSSVRQKVLAQLLQKVEKSEASPQNDERSKESSEPEILDPISKFNKMFDFNDDSMRYENLSWCFQ